MHSCPSVPDETWYWPEHILCRVWLTVHCNNKPETWFNDSSYMYIHVYTCALKPHGPCTHCIHAVSNMYMHFNQISNTGFEALYRWTPRLLVLYIGTSLCSAYEDTYRMYYALVTPHFLHTRKFANVSSWFFWVGPGDEASYTYHCLQIPVVCRPHLHHWLTRIHHRWCPRSHSSTTLVVPGLELNYPQAWGLHCCNKLK